MVAYNVETYCHSVAFMLDHMWPGIDFRVDIARNEYTMECILRIRVPGTNGGHMYVSQKFPVEELHATKPPRITDETLATITLLLG